MKIVFNRQGKKHVCSTCLRPFKWDENSWAFYRNLEDETTKWEYCSDEEFSEKLDRLEESFSERFYVKRLCDAMPKYN